MNLGKLVPLEIRGRLGNTKITKEIFFDVGLGCALYHWKAKEKGFPTSKEYANLIPG